MIERRASMFSNELKSKNSNSKQERRSGIMKAYIGTNHDVKVQGRVAKFQVREYSKHPDAIGEYICLNCCKKYDDEESMRAAHPSDEVMQRRGEPHVIALWSDDPTVVEEPVKGADGKVIPQRVDPFKVIGLLSDEWPPA